MIRRALRLTPAAVALALVACGPPHVQPWEFTPRPLADTLAIHEPAERQTSLIYDQVVGVGSGIGRALNVRRAVAGPPPALNTDPFDEVVNSSWFTNRITLGTVTPADVFRGPRATAGPDQSGDVVVSSIKTEGVTPGFNIEDASGERWIVKFDPPNHPELASGAEVVATNLFWAAGYNVPENHVFYLDPSHLVLGDDLEADFVEGDSLVEYEVGADEPEERELTMEAFTRNLLDRYPREPNGTIRALASKFLEGVPKGPYAYTGVRTDDPNDVIPHQHRRELRGMYAIASWLNHTDVKQGNSLDMFIVDPRSPEGEDAPRIGHLQHYLIDFGSTLGSGASHPKTPRNGTEYSFDGQAILLRTLTFGLYERPWQDFGEQPFPTSIGYYSVDNFNPADWRSNIVNQAFVTRTPRDGYWGAKIVMAFTDEHLAEAVRAGDYSDARAADYLLTGLKERRDTTGRYWFRQVSPLDRPRIESGAVVFDDLWARHFGGPGRYEYRFEWDTPDPDLEADGTATEARITLPEPPAGTRGADGDDAYARLDVWKIFGSDERAPRPATIWLAPQGAGWRIAGVRY